MNIYIGNLSREVTEDDLREAFEAFGAPTSVNVIKDKFSGESKGFGFVEIEAKAQAQEAIQALDGTEIKGKRIIVNEARPKTDNRRGGGGGGGGRRW